jgi:hypothetical protein
MRPAATRIVHAERMHVVINRDWLDYFALAAGIVGSLLAGFALFVAARARRDIVKDRCEVFELTGWVTWLSGSPPTRAVHRKSPR